MRDRVNVVILLVGIALMVGLTLGVKASDVLNRAQESLAEQIATDRYIGLD